MIELQQLAPKPDQAPSTPPYRQHIAHPAAWKASDFTSPRDYTIELTPAQIEDIQAAVRTVRAAGLKLDDIEQRHFPLPKVLPVIKEIRHQIADGRGFVLVSQLPVDRF